MQNVDFGLNIIKQTQETRLQKNIFRLPEKWIQIFNQILGMGFRIITELTEGCLNQLLGNYRGGNFMPFLNRDV